MQNTSNEEITAGQAYCLEYREEIMKLMKYVPWLESVGSDDVAKKYDGSLGKSDISFPVYDSTLMTFVKELQKSVFMDKNYPYAYTRRHIRTPEDEVRCIENAGINDMDLFKGVLTKYTMEGMRKANMWAEAVERKLYLKVINKMYEILMFYTPDKSGGR